MIFWCNGTRKYDGLIIECSELSLALQAYFIILEMVELIPT